MAMAEAGRVRVRLSTWTMPLGTSKKVKPCESPTTACCGCTAPRAEGACVAVLVKVGVSVLVKVVVIVQVGVGVTVLVKVGVAVLVKVDVLVLVKVGVAVFVSLGVDVGEIVLLCVSVKVEEMVLVLLKLGVQVGVGAAPVRKSHWADKLAFCGYNQGPKLGKALARLFMGAYSIL
jgi:hypothetical protein